MTTPIRGIIFDLDGVLLSTDEFHYRAWQELADREGIGFDRQINHRLRGVSRMTCLEILLEKSTRSYTDAEKSALADFKNDRYRQLLGGLDSSAVSPAVWQLLRDLRARGVALAIGSSSRNTPLIMKLVGLTPLFDAVADGNDLTKTKPDPQVFLIAAERLGLPPAACLVVEDAPAGVEAGRRAGMRVLAIGPRTLHPDAENLAATLDDITVEDLLRCV